MEAPVRPADVSPLFALLEAAHAARAAADLATSATSFTATQCRIAYVLSDAVNGKPQVEIAARTGLSPAATSTMLDRLARTGAVWRAANDLDRRVLLAGLTDRGIEQWRRASECCSRFDTAMARQAQTTPQRLADTLRRIAEALPSEWHIQQQREADAPHVPYP